MPVTVVVPLFDGAPWIEETLRSVRAQTLAPSEIIVVDDGSTDGSPGIARSFEGVRLVSSDGSGSAAARSLGLRRTRTPLVAFLDHDDVWHPDHLRLLSAALDRYPDAAAAASSCATFTVDPPVLATEPNEPAPLDMWEPFPFACPIWTTSCVLARRDALEAAGGWDVSYTGIADWLLWLRLSVDKDVVGVPAPTVGWRRHDRSQTVSLQRRGSHYFELHARTARAALEDRFRRRQENRERLEHRCRMFEQLTRVVAASAAGEKLRLKTAALEFDRAAAAEPDRELDAAFHCATRICLPETDRDGLARSRVRLLATWDAAWPPAARRTRAAIARCAARGRWRDFLGALAGGHVREARSMLRFLARRAWA